MAGERYPFGNPDGAQASFGEFVPFPGRGYVGISTQDDDRTARIFVGAKGTGKTVYLKHQQAAAVLEESIYADDVQADFPPTDLVVRFSGFFRDERTRVSKWAQVWRIAVIRSLTAHLVHADRFRQYVSLDDIDFLRARYKDLKTRFPNEVLSIYSQATEVMLYGDPDSKNFLKYVASPYWNEVEYKIASIMQEAPPICFYLDSLDNEYDIAPAYWLSCQQGLAEQVMRFTKDFRLDSRLHIAVGIRDVVYSAMLRGEHANRVRGQPQIRVLSWTNDALRHLLHEKVRRLPRSAFPQNGSRDLNNWIGFATVRNAHFDVDEDVGTYILRHTRFSPRDVVQLGNAISQAIQAATAQKDRITEAELRQTVKQWARTFGEEQVSICANQIRADITSHSGERGVSMERMTNAYGENLRIEAVIRELMREYLALQFDADQLEVFRTQARLTFDGATDLPSVLWQNGLLGFAPDRESKDNGRFVFYNPSQSDRYNLGIHHGHYCLHPCLVDSIDNLPITGNGPVLPSSEVKGA